MFANGWKGGRRREAEIAKGGKKRSKVAEKQRRKEGKETIGGEQALLPSMGKPNEDSVYASFALLIRNGPNNFLSRLIGHLCSLALKVSLFSFSLLAQRIFKSSPAPSFSIAIIIIFFLSL